MSFSHSISFHISCSNTLSHSASISLFLCLTKSFILTTVLSCLTFFISLCLTSFAFLLICTALASQIFLLHSLTKVYATASDTSDDRNTQQATSDATYCGNVFYCFPYLPLTYFYATVFTLSSVDLLSVTQLISCWHLGALGVH